MVNKAILVGRLGRDPEVRYTQDGTMVTSFSIATDESFKNKAGEKEKRTEWHRISSFGKLAEICGNYLTIGSLVYCEGRLHTNSWEKDGHKFYSTEIVLQQMKMLGGGRRSEEQSQGQPAPGQSEQSYPDEDVPF